MKFSKSHSVDMVNYTITTHLTDAGTKSKSLDAHRFVLFFGYHYSDTVKFRSEFELEHALAMLKIQLMDQDLVKLN